MRCFLVGLGIYLASVWIHSPDVGSSKVSNLWTMNTYYIAVAVGLSLFISPSSYKNFSLARDRETLLQQHDSFGKWDQKGTMEPGAREVSGEYVSETEKHMTSTSSNRAMTGEHIQALRGIEKALRASAAAHEQSARDMLAAAEHYQRLTRNA